MQTSAADNSGFRFSAVIVNYNGGDMLADCVRSVLQEGISAGNIVVVDNGSRDRSLASIVADFPTIKVIRNRCNAGFARAVNQGLVQASGDFILLLNNDAQLQPGALCALATAFDGISNLAIAGGQLRYPDGRLQNAIARFPTLISELLPHTLLEWMFPSRFKGTTVSDEPVMVESVIGACVAVRRAILPILGFMDEDYFFFYEETEWCRRAKRLGLDVYHVPAARALHLQGGTAKRFRGNARIEFQRSKLTFFKKTHTPAIFLCASMLVMLGTLVDAVVNTTLCILTCFAVKRLRTKTRVYLHVLAWHLLGRPASWGLPDKCPKDTIRGAEMPEFQSFVVSNNAVVEQPSTVEAAR